MPAACAPRASARATSRPVAIPPVAMIVSKPSGARSATEAAVGTPQSQKASPRARAALVARGFCAPRLDADPRGAPGARDVDVPHAHRAQPLPTAGEIPQPVSLTTTGTPRPRTSRASVSTRARSPGRRPVARAPSRGSGARRARRRPPRRRARAPRSCVIARAWTTPTLPSSERARRDLAHAVRGAGRPAARASPAGCRGRSRSRAPRRCSRARG